ncbi:MAG TPA: phage tail protein, partial [Blastocatellia bacterium]|nr:phage tail protein [Blastocatellia bacterium]
MAQFTVNTQRIDPYLNFKFRVKWQSEPGGTFAVVAGVSKVGALKRSTEIVSHREGGDISTERLSP